MLTKKNVLLISGAVSILLVFIDRIGTYQLCGGYPGLCVDTLFNSSMLLFVFPFVFLFSVVTYFLSESVFRAWVNFAKWWVPVQILLVALIPESSGGYFVAILDKQFAAIILSGLFATISLLIILISWFRSRTS
ncbi:MAG: hypothetical protein Q8L52_00495 [bacterium]|nr:hypothetical protein [bacterium]